MAEWKEAGNCKGLGGTARELGAPRTPGAVRVNPFGDALAPLKTQGYKATKSMWLQVAKYATQGPAFLKATHWIPLKPPLEKIAVQSERDLIL